MNIIVIDKEELLEKINKRKSQNILSEAKYEEDIDIISLVNSLESKNINLDEETLHSELRKIYTSIYDSKDIEAAKHFYKLGLQSSKDTLTEEDMKLVWTLGDEIPRMSEEDFYKELLKRYKEKMSSPLIFSSKKSEEKDGVGNNDNFIQFEDGTWIDLDPSMQLNPAFKIKEGEKVKVVLIRKEK